MDPLGGKAIAEAAAKLPAEMQEFATAVMAQMTVLETKSALDVNAIADKVLAGLKPMVEQATGAVNTMTLTVNASVVEVTALVRRIDGASMRFSLGPEIPDDPASASVTVRG